MKQKIVIKLGMECDKCRNKALKIAAEVPGVTFVSIEGDKKDHLVVTGDNLDMVCLANRLKKKFRSVIVLSVEDITKKTVEEKKKKKKKEEEGEEKKKEEEEKMKKKLCYVHSSASHASFSSSFFPYDVFLSFRGSDTSHGFADNLYKALCDKGIRTFFDDVELRKGDEITPSVVKAIKESRVAIIIFSTNYAASSFCLDELVNIKAQGRLFLPIFYDVDPSEVRHQKGTYGEALAKHEERFKDNLERVHKWRTTLCEAANLSGWHLNHWDECEHQYIEMIVEDVSNEINRTPLYVADHPVGLEPRVREVCSLLDVGSDDGVRMVGIVGMGGVGKTTLAQAVYNVIADCFEGSCFLESVRENSIKHGLVHLQERLLSTILGERDIQLGSVIRGISMIKHKLQHKRVLLVLDDVDQKRQLEVLAGEYNWFGHGSRVIIATRDMHLLRTHGIKIIYEVGLLNKEDALELFTRSAFKVDKIDPNYMDISKQFLDYASGLPLALKVLSSFLFGRSIKEWKSTLDKLERIPPIHILDIFKLSFDALEEEEKMVFLDIACCFNGYELIEVEDILCAHHGGYMEAHIRVLIDKYLISVSSDGKVILHRLIEDMGKEIVRQESPHEPGRRSRLWFFEDIIEVLKENTGTDQIEVIHLDSPLLEVVGWDGKAFKKMTRLKTLIIRNCHFSRGPKHLPNNLRVLEWWRYPSEDLPSDFNPKNLAILKLPNTHILSPKLAELLKIERIPNKVIQDMDREIVAEESLEWTSRHSRSWFSCEWTYDVFLSFSGQDTRTGFSGYLFNALKDKGIRTFISDLELKRGKQITTAIIKEIEESRIAIVVLSKNYVSSPHCLDEFVMIIECIKGKGRLVLPVFYDMDPSDAQHERGSYGEVLANYEKMFKDNQLKVIKWRKALLQATNLSGWHIKYGDGYEYEFTERIVEEVSKRINRVALPVADYPVGLRSQVLKVISRLDVVSNEGVIVVGVHGIGGIGKTTVALAIYNLIADHFDSFCFIENVREFSNKYGLVHLLEILLSKIVGEKKIKLASVKEGISIIQHRLQQKKILLILDDVDKLEQLETMVGGFDWFGSGSRVIITTRDKHLLTAHGIEITYEVKKLNEKEASELLRWKALRTDKVDPSCGDIVNFLAAYASGLPLALEVIGSNLFGKRKEEWESVLIEYERILPKTIPNMLRVSFDGLDEVEKNIFLDIACFFKGYKLEDFENILCAQYDVDMKFVIRVLVEKSLIKINQSEVTLHDLIQDMGREIVRQESPEEPGERSRLWFYEDIVHVLEENTGTSNIQVIILEFPLFKEKVVEWDGEAFRKMQDLKTLIIRNGHFSKCPEHLPNSLRVLEWEGYPSQSLPSDFHPKKLAVFKLASTCFMSFELSDLQKKFVNLRVLNFDECEFLIQIPDVSSAPNLEKLSFGYCENLTKIHESIGFLDRLRILDAEGCSKIRTFPPMKLTSLEELYLSHCSSLESFPEILGEMENITLLDLQYTPIKNLPISIQNLTRLGRLELHGCGMLQLPSSIVKLPKLGELSVWQCEGLQLCELDECREKVSSMVSSNMKHVDFLACNISDEVLQRCLTWFASVKELDLSLNNFTVLPACIKECQVLRKLNLDYCMHLQEIRGIPPHLETFSAKQCTSLNELDLTVLPAGISFLRELILDDCKNLREIRGISPYIELLSATNCTSLTSLCSSMLLNQELHEAYKKRFCLPGTRIPGWFEHSRRGPSISFWFRNKFPALSLCLVGHVHKHPIKFRPIMIINGSEMRTEFLTANMFYFEVPLVTDHIFIFGEKQIKFEDNLDEVLLVNEWNHVVVSIDIDITWNPTALSVMQTGLHVFNQSSSMEDILFSDPYDHLFMDENHILVDTGVSQRQFTQQHKKLSSLAIVEPPVRHGKECLSLPPPPALKSYSSSITVQGIQEQRFSSSIQQNLEGCECENEAKGKGMVELNSRSPLLELLPMTKEYQETSEKCQPASDDNSMAWDPMELERPLTYSEDQFVSNDESTMNDGGSHVMGSESNHESRREQFSWCALISFFVSLCSSSCLTVP